MRKEALIKTGALVLLLLLFIAALAALIEEMSKPPKVGIVVDWEKKIQPGTTPEEE